MVFLLFISLGCILISEVFNKSTTLQASQIPNQQHIELYIFTIPHHNQLQTLIMQSDLIPNFAQINLNSLLIIIIYTVFLICDVNGWQTMIFAKIARFTMVLGLHH